MRQERVEIWQDDQDEHRWRVSLVSVGKEGDRREIRRWASGVYASFAVRCARYHADLRGNPWGVVDIEGEFHLLSGSTPEAALEKIVVGAYKHGLFMPCYMHEQHA
jgi:hypothetical protein